MRVLLIDTEGQFLDFALRCLVAGHEVILYKYPEKGRVARDGEGFKGLKVVTDWRPYMKWAKDGLIMTSGNFKFIVELDRYRETGYKIFAPTSRSAELEIKRGVGMEAMKAVGIDTPPYHTFQSLEDAEMFARKADQAYVFKTMGDEEDKSLSFVASDPAELCGWITQKIKRGMVLKGPCMLQEKIDMACEFGVSGWVGPEGFLPKKYQICFEHKKLMDGEIGPNTGEMGTVCQYVETDKLVDECLLPMEPILKVLGHRGDFAVGVGIDTKGKAWPFEFSARCGWPAFHIQVASHRGDPAEWMRALLDGEDTLRVSQQVAIGVVMGQPFFPYGKSQPERVEGNPISGLDGVWDDAHPVAVMMGRGPTMAEGSIKDAPIFQTTGEYVLVATGLGPTIEKSRKKVYETVKAIKFPDAMYRTDIGCKVQKALPELHKFGYALQMEE